LKSHGIYKAYIALLDFTDDPDIVEFFCEHKVVLGKENPEKATADAAAFILLVQEACNLILTRDELIEIGRSVGADPSFFIGQY
jgi:4-diphosphocytidyl-2-C-methyl-D-erythritol kinase